jgi:chromosome partitioning protein
MVDRRRLLHRAAMEKHPDWPVIPMASAVEQMAIHRAAVGSFALSSAAGQAFATIWKGVERRLTKGK